MPIKPSTKEEEYFAREEFERQKRIEEEKQAKMEQEERTKLKEMHNMHCPKCGNNLIEINYKDILVDKCSSCDGIWLDTGELETILKMEENSIGKWLNVFRK